MRRTAAVLCLALLIAALGASAHEGATGMIAERMDAMKALGRSAKTISDMVTGRQPFDEATVAQHAKQARDAGRKASTLFPPGTRDHHSHALQAIWDDPAGFEREMKALQGAADALAQADPGNRTAVATRLGALRETCSSCHDKFRQPD